MFHIDFKFGNSFQANLNLGRFIITKKKKKNTRKKTIDELEFVNKHKFKDSSERLLLTVIHCICLSHLIWPKLVFGAKKGGTK